MLINSSNDKFNSGNGQEKISERNMTLQAVINCEGICLSAGERGG